MDFNIIVAFWCVSILFIMTPGLDWAYVISAGQHGRHVVSAVFGLLLGHFMAIVVVASGIGTLVTNHPTVMTLLTLSGAGYLFWNGVQMLINPAFVRQSHDNNEQTHRDLFIKGTCISGLNPKVFLLFLALLPQFTDPHSSWPFSAQLLVLGGLHVVSCCAVYLFVGFFSKWVLSTRPAVSMIISRASGVFMLTIAISLFYEKLTF